MAEEEEYTKKEDRRCFGQETSTGGPTEVDRHHPHRMGGTRGGREGKVTQRSVLSCCLHPMPKERLKAKGEEGGRG